MSEMWYHPGTGTYMPVEDCVIVDVPDHLDADAIEMYLEDLDLF